MPCSGCLADSRGDDAAVNATADAKKTKDRRTALLLCLALVLFAAALRAYGLGADSLWADEFATWHVFRLPLGESVRWGPELTKPPLYQLILRLITDDPRPPEWLLRLPAAIAGALAVGAMFYLGRMAGGTVVGAGAALLLACSRLHIDYSQEARSYTLLVLTATASTALWYRLVLRGGRATWIGYCIAATAGFYSHYLMVLAIAAHGAWWLLRFLNTGGVSGGSAGGPPKEGRTMFPPAAALLAVAACCAPMMLHYFRFRSSTFQGLTWIQPPTWGKAIAILGDITAGMVWVAAAIVLAIVLWLMGAIQSRRAAIRTISRAYAGPDDVAFLLLIWLIFGWFGLMVVSWTAHPAMVDRYALAAGVPGLLLPVLIVARLHRGTAIALAAVFSGIHLAGAVEDRTDVQPGFRELSRFVSEEIDPAGETVLLVVDLRTHPDWADFERLCFEYYPVITPDGVYVPPSALYLAEDGVSARNPEVLRDPRGMYMAVLWADPFAILGQAGRVAQPIVIDRRTYSQLLFSPYRLVKVAPITTGEPTGAPS